MNQHVHYDLVSAEKSMRAGFAEMNNTPRPETMTDRDHDFVRVQIDLQEAQVQFALWHLRRINNCTEIDIVIKAAGHAIGTMIWSLADNTDFEPIDVAKEVMTIAVETVGALMAGGTPGCLHSKTTVPGDKGGRA